MTIEVTDKLVGMWQFCFDNGDFMAGLTEQDDGTFFLQYRFRYYKDDKIGMDSQDEKRWYEGTLTGSTRQQVIDQTREIMDKIVRFGDMFDEEIEVVEILMHNGDVDAFIEELTAQPWAHAQEVPPKAEMN